MDSFSHVVADGVWQDDHAALALLQFFGDRDGSGHGGPGASSCYRENAHFNPSSNVTTPTSDPKLTAQQAFFSNEHSGHVEGLLVVGLVPRINNLEETKTNHED